MPSLRPHLVLSVACSLSLLAPIASAADAARATLPVKTVRLYEAGVAYFERSGDLASGREVVLPVPAAHLDDALKTLVVLGDGATVSGVEFRSSVSPEMARAVAGLPSGDETIDYARLVRSLKGVPVEARFGHETVHGRVLDVVPAGQADASECVAAEAPKAQPAAAPPPTPCALQKQMSVLLLTDRAEIRRIRSSELSSLRPTDPALATRLGAALDAVSAGASQAARPLRVKASGAARVLTLGYITEAPVWRSTYRLVLDKDTSGVLQGWALVHNDTDEDWNKIRLELVNGRPDSFLFPLAAPRYARRELVTPTDTLSTIPQLLGKTVDSLWGDAIGDSFGAGGIGMSGIGEGGGGRGEGIGLGSIGTIGHGSGSGTGGDDASSVLSVGNLAAVAQADGVESGALFRYTLPAPIDVRGHASTLVPFLHKNVTARRITYFAGASAPARSAARFKNDTGQTLPPGTIAFFADGGFAGEAKLDRMKPGDATILGFGADLDVELTLRRDDSADHARLLAYENERVVEHFIRHHTIDYDLVNRSQSARVVFIALAIGTNARVAGADEVDFDRPTNHPLAAFHVGAKAEKTPRLEIDEGLSRSHALTDLTAKDLGALAREPGLPPSQRGLLRSAAADLAGAEARLGGIPDLDAATQRVTADLARVRLHLSAARSGRSANDFAARIAQGEDQLQALRARITTLRVEADVLARRARTTLTRLHATDRS